MTFGMFIFLLVWIAACTAKPEPKTMLGQIDTREPGDYNKILAEYGKKY
jgi:hypothetical protein